MQREGSESNAREKIPDFGVKRVGRRRVDGPETAPEREQRWEADLDGQLFSLRCCFSANTLLFFSFFLHSSLFGPGGVRARPRVSVSCARSGKHVTRGGASWGVLNPSRLDAELSLNDFNGLRAT